MESLEVLVENAKNIISAIIQKPKMSEKLLSKPPFRFLHDTITAITNATGFANGLYNESELDSAAITEKTQKIEYLEKIFTMVGICQVCLFVLLYIVMC
jgi:TRAF3-interacting protein 1